MIDPLIELGINLMNFNDLREDEALALDEPEMFVSIKCSATNIFSNISHELPNEIQWSFTDFYSVTRIIGSCTYQSFDVNTVPRSNGVCVKNSNCVTDGGAEGYCKK